MARLNTRPSNIRSTRFESETPSVSHPVSQISDEENVDPRSRSKGTPTSHNRPLEASQTSIPRQAMSEIQHAQKRRRLHGTADVSDSLRDERSTRDYGLDQDANLRRDVKKESRLLERDFYERREELLRDSGTGLKETVQRANSIFKKVTRTGDATVDSRLLVNVSDLSKRKAAQMVLGDNSSGLDVDEFLSKCLALLRQTDTTSRATQATSSHTRGNSDGSEDEGEGENLDWSTFGRNVCLPRTRRPAVPTFLLGPLSIEKKQRTQTQRRARQTRDTNTREARPEAVSREDLTQSDENGLTAVCTKIRNRLASHLQSAETALLQAGIGSEEELRSERGFQLLRKHRLASNGAVPLFDFVINPHSFGQTVENLFYVSFLIKEGSLGVEPDEDGLPTLSPAKPSDPEDVRRANGEHDRSHGRGNKTNRFDKHQAVFALDYHVWQQLIQAFDIRDPMIPHRQDEAPTQIGSRGWYS